MPFRARNVYMYGANVCHKHLCKFISGDSLVQIHMMKAPLKIGIGFLVFFIFTILIGWIVFPLFLEHTIKKSLVLKEGTDTRAMWSKPPFAIDFKVYVFNVTNADDVMLGKKPKLQEIGPYFFDEYKNKENLRDDEATDTICYNPRNTWIFKPERSEGLTGNENVTLLHPFMMSLITITALEKPAMMATLIKAIKSVFDNPVSPFLTVPVLDLLFNGILIDCSKQDFAAKALCKLLETEATNLIREGDKFRFSFFGSKNGTLDRPFNVTRGVKNSIDLGRMVAFDNKTKMDIWSTEHCNKLSGTDSTIFPPFLTQNDQLVSFAPDLCRSLGATFEKAMVFKGIPVNRYTANLGDMSRNKAEKCFCPRPDFCHKKGLFDLTKCNKAPIYATLPHFYLTDESYMKGVEGLAPEASKHEVFINFEPMTGTPLAARKRLQFNFPLMNLSRIEWMKDLPNSVVPLFWVEEGLELNATYIKALDDALFKTLRIAKIMKWTCLSLSLVGIAVSALLYFQKRQSFNVSPTTNGNINRNILSVDSANGPRNLKEMFDKY